MFDSKSILSPSLVNLNDGKLATHLKLFLLSRKTDGLSPKTLIDYAQKIGKFIECCHHGRLYYLDQVTTMHVRLYIAALQENHKPGTVHSHYGTLNVWFNWLASDEIKVIEKNPMSPMRPPKVPQTIIKPFRPEHIETLANLCPAGTFLGVRNRAIVLLFTDTGLRLSELAGIQLADIDFDRFFIRVMGKGQKERLVSFGKKSALALVKYLLLRKDGLGCLWVNEERRPLKWRGVQSAIQQLARLARLQDVRCSPHTFRHTFGTMSLRNGANELDVQNLMGHSTRDMTYKYVKTISCEEAAIKQRPFSPVDNLHIK
ncbi:MAG: tyrosine-type recombinase/integrase [Dehalococcoidales bacterium]|nr:tyrosine-type recombinase/integrase [Dehalococcoidales bacterium]